MNFVSGKVRQKIGVVFGAGILIASIPLGIAGATGPAEVFISNCAQLQKIGNDVNYPLSSEYFLNNNIDCTAATSSGGALYNSGQGFAPIGDSSHAFTGTFKGQGYTITGLKINRGSDTDVALFANADSATFENLHFVNGSVTGDSNVGLLIGVGGDLTLSNVTADTSHVASPNNTNGFTGGIIGSNDTGLSHLTHVYFGGSVSSNGYSVGGLVGDNDGNAAINESGSSADITCDDSNHECNYIGGMVGDSDGQLTISKSFATGDVNGGSTSSDSVGGLVGWSDNDDISNSYASGNVAGFDNVGGFIGNINGGTIDKSYSSGTVTASGTDVGGFIGQDGSDVITNSFFDITNAPLGVCGSGVCTGATGLGTVGMQTNSNFAGAGWDFGSTWRQETGENNGFPFLQWNAYKSSINPVTGKDAVLVVSDGCQVKSMNMQDASLNAAQDAGYKYPQGMMDFTLRCGTSGFRAQITQYIFGVAPGTYTVRKYNSVTHKYATVPGAKVSFLTITHGPNNGSVAKIVYSVTDGSSLDSDGTANGIIVDPVGLAVSTAPTAPDTGYGTPASGNRLVAAMLLGGTASLVAMAYAVRRKHFQNK